MTTAAVPLGGSGHIAIVQATSAVSNVDPSRRVGLRVGPGDVTWFPGLTTPEAEQVAQELGGGCGEWAGHGSPDPGSSAVERLLVRIELPVILSDGAGPHLLDPEGRLTLVLGAHPAIADAWIAMGEPRPRQPAGLVAPCSTDADALLWRWLARREVHEGERVPALDALHDLDDIASAVTWERVGPGRPTR